MSVTTGLAASVRTGESVFGISVWACCIGRGRYVLSLPLIFSRFSLQWLWNEEAVLTEAMLEHHRHQSDNAAQSRPAQAPVRSTGLKHLLRPERVVVAG